MCLVVTFGCLENMAGVMTELWCVSRVCAEWGWSDMPKCCHAVTSWNSVPTCLATSGRLLHTDNVALGISFLIAHLGRNSLCMIPQLLKMYPLDCSCWHCILCGDVGAYHAVDSLLVCILHRRHRTLSSVMMLCMNVGFSSTHEMRSWQIFFLVWCCTSVIGWETTYDEFCDVIRSSLKMAGQLACDICSVVAKLLTVGARFLCTMHFSLHLLFVLCTYLGRQLCTLFFSIFHLFWNWHGHWNPVL
jgi:hypothetical protein